MRGTAPTVCASRAQISKRMIYPKNLCARALPCMATRNLSIESLVASLLPAAGAASADIRLPRVVGDNMVLQRDAPLKLWGWADPGERVQIRFRDQKISTTADPSGAWSVTLTPLRAGGPSQSRPHDRGETTSFGYSPMGIEFCGPRRRRLGCGSRTRTVRIQSCRLRARAILWPHGRSPRQRIMGAEELEELGAAKLLGVVLSGPTSGFDTAVIGKSSKLRMMLSLLSNPSRPECTFGNSLAPP